MTLTRGLQRSVLSRLALLLAAILFLGRTEAAQFVELTAEIELNAWSYWFFEDKLGFAERSGKPKKSAPHAI